MKHLLLWDPTLSSARIARLTAVCHPDAIYNLAKLSDGSFSHLSLSSPHTEDERLQACFFLENIACCLASPALAPRIAESMLRYDGRVLHDGLFALAFGPCIASHTPRLLFAYHDGPSWLYQVGKGRIFIVLGRSPSRENAVLLDGDTQQLL